MLAKPNPHGQIFPRPAFRLGRCAPLSWTAELSQTSFATSGNSKFDNSIAHQHTSSVIMDILSKKYASTSWNTLFFENSRPFTTAETHYFLKIQGHLQQRAACSCAKIYQQFICEQIQLQRVHFLHWLTPKCMSAAEAPEPRTCPESLLFLNLNWWKIAFLNNVKRKLDLVRWNIRSSQRFAFLAWAVHTTD